MKQLIEKIKALEWAELIENDNTEFIVNDKVLLKQHDNKATLYFLTRKDDEGIITYEDRYSQLKSGFIMKLTELMDFDNKITCIGKDGTENDFLYNLEKSDFKDKWTFKIIPAEIDVDDWFEFSIQKTKDNKGKVVQMKHQNMPEYIAKGIPDKMIEEASEVLNLEIISSTNIQSAKSFDPEWRTTEATKVWKRLMANGKAKHDTKTDIYTFQPA